MKKDLFDEFLTAETVLANKNRHRLQQRGCLNEMINHRSAERPLASANCCRLVFSTNWRAARFPTQQSTSHQPTVRTHIHGPEDGRSFLFIGDPLMHTRTTTQRTVQTARCPYRNEYQRWRCSSPSTVFVVRRWSIQFTGGLSKSPMRWLMDANNTQPEGCQKPVSINWHQ